MNPYRTQRFAPALAPLALTVALVSAAAPIAASLAPATVDDEAPMFYETATVRARALSSATAAVTVLVQPVASVRGRAATLWVVVDDRTRAAPTVHVDGVPLRPGQAVPIHVGESGRVGRTGERRDPCARQGRLARVVWRYVVPAGRLANTTVKIQLRDPSGGGAVARAVALLPLAGSK